MKRIIITLLSFAAMAISFLSCSKELPASDNIENNQDDMSAEYILPTFAQNGCSISSIQETKSAFLLTFADPQTVVLPNGRIISECMKYTVTKSDISGCRLEEKSVCFLLNNGSSVTFPYKTDSSEKLNDIDNDAVVKDITCSFTTDSSPISSGIYKGCFYSGTEITVSDVVVVYSDGHQENLNRNQYSIDIVNNFNAGSFLLSTTGNTIRLDSPSGDGGTTIVYVMHIASGKKVKSSIYKIVQTRR